MNCNTGKRKEFADDLVKAVSELCKKHGLDEVIVNRDLDPVMVAARGCLNQSGEVEQTEHVEMVLHISPNLQKTETLSLIGAKLVNAAAVDVYRAFDLSEVVATDSIARGQSLEDDQECK